MSVNGLSLGVAIQFTYAFFGKFGITNTTATTTATTVIKPLNTALFALIID